MRRSTLPQPAACLQADAAGPEEDVATDSPEAGTWPHPASGGLHVPHLRRQRHRQALTGTGPHTRARPCAHEKCFVWRAFTATDKADKDERVCEASFPSSDKQNKPLVNSRGHAGITQRSFTQLCQAFYLLVRFLRCQDTKKGKA